MLFPIEFHCIRNKDEINTRKKTQINKPIISVKLGAARNNIQLARTGTIISFNNNLRPSANACKIPQNPVTLGPLRR